MRREMLRAVTEDEIATYWRDGVVCLRGVVDQSWLDSLAEPIEALMSAPGGVDLTAAVQALRTMMGDDQKASDPLFGDVGKDDFLEDDVARAEGAKFFNLTHVSPLSEPIRAFEMQSMLPEIAARLLRSSQIHLFIDQVFVKEPGTPTRTAFHVDESYFNLTGEQVCTMWVPLDAATRESSTMGYVRGSHQWADQYAPNNFISQNQYVPAAAEGISVPERVRLPDIEGNPDQFDIVYFDVEPGDVIVHHTRTAHGSGGNATMNRRRRALSVRYTGDDVRWGPMPRAGERLPHTLREGDSLDRAEDVFPTCWPTSAMVDS
jgi:ectoine hydroxylase-related dioxygenase (phytanoyl-CoA dioxygenase family)